jgi:hypothetical protein
MPQPAKVTSIDALDAFKASLIVYLEKAGRILDGVSEDVVRTRIWLESDRQLHWKNRVRQQTKELAQAEQELLTARLSEMPEAIKARGMAVNKAKLNLRDAEDGLARTKQWIRQYETQVQSHARVVTQLRHALAHDMSRAVVFLEEVATTLAAYAQMSPPIPSISLSPLNATDDDPSRGATSEPTSSDGGGAT